MLFVCSVFLFLLAIPGPLWLLTIFAVMTRLTANGAFGVIYVLTPELFPTVLRGTGLGVCMSFSRLGGVATPYVATTLFKVNTWLPLVIYGVACLIAGVLTITIPKETAGQHLKDNYAEENQSEL
jgi:OCT family organic cation transporter-like MFS transporter 4/5